MGQGGGRGAGGGRGWRHMFRAPVPSVSSPEAELPALKQQASDLERALGALQARIQELEQLEGEASSSPRKDGR